LISIGRLTAAMTSILETAELAIRDLVRTPDPKRVKIEDIPPAKRDRKKCSEAQIVTGQKAAIS
jgi:chromosomal replication initiator protein